MVESRSFIYSQLRNGCLEKQSGGCKANEDFYLVRRGGKDGMKNIFSPFGFTSPRVLTWIVWCPLDLSPIYPY